MSPRRIIALLLAAAGITALVALVIGSIGAALSVVWLRAELQKNFETQAVESASSVSELIQQATRTTDLLLDVAGRKQQATTNVLVVSPEWLETRARIVTALAPYHEARAAVAAALAAVPKAIGA